MNPRTFYLTNNPRNRASVIESAASFISDLPLDSEFQVEVSLRDETRRDAQNRLIWRWNKELAAAMGLRSANEAHGMAKLDILLPLMLGWDDTHTRAIFVSNVLSHVPARSHKIGVAFDMVRSKDLTVKQCAEYLTEYQLTYSAEGIQLTSGDDVYDKAIGNTERKAA